MSAPAANPATPPGPSPPPPTTVTDPALRNLVLFGIVVAAFLGWCYANLRWPFVGVGALAVTGALSGLLVIPKLLPEDVSKALQKRVWEGLFAHPRATRVYQLFLVVELLVFGCLGYVQVEALQEGAGREVRLLDPSAGDADDYDQRLHDAAAEQLAPDKPVREPYWLWPWGGRDVLVKVNGLPDRVVPVRRFAPEPVYVPGGFRQRPVVLLLPTARLINFRLDKEVMVTVNGTALPRLPFTGHALWVGCDDDVEVPKTLADNWNRAMSGGDVVYLGYWLNPKALPGRRLQLKPGGQITVQVFNATEKTKYTDPLAILIRQTTFPQVESLDAP